MRFAWAGAALAMLAATVPLAKAADINPYSDSRWTGFYVGARTGVGANSSDWDQNDGATPYGKLGTATANAGLFAGYNLQIDRAVLGIELGADWLNAKTDASDELNTGIAFTNDWTFNVSGRLGALLTPNTLLYGKAGWAAIETKAPSGYWFTESDSQWLNGLQVGVGMESKLTDRVTLRAEADYTTALQHMTVGFLDDRVRPSFLTAQLGLAYQFGDVAKASDNAPAFGQTADWTGFYVSGHGGAAAGGSQLFDYFADRNYGPFSEIGGTLGASIGYDWQLTPKVVVGVEGDATWLNLHNAAAGETSPFVRYDWMASVTGRAGYLFDPNTLVYAKAGWAVIDTRGTDYYFGTDARSKALNGVQVGAGIEARVTPHVSVKFEGLYTTALEKLEMPFAGIPDINSLKPSVVSGNVGLVVRF